MPVDPVRETAVRILLRVFEQSAFLNVATERALAKKAFPDRSRRFAVQLVYGVVRHKLLCDHVLTPVVRQPLAELPAPILTILRMGVFQALFLRQVTPPAMVHTSVDLAKRFGHAGTARLVNAVLKRIPRSLDDLELPDPALEPSRYLSIRQSIPEWLVQEWMQQFGPDTAEAICRASSSEAPHTIRVNRLAIEPDALREQLERAGCTVEKCTPIPEELSILSGPPPSRSKLFSAGQYFVQDAASMLPAHLMEPGADETILDLCAAPGGKSTHLAELSRGRAKIVAFELHPRKARLIIENLARLDTPGVSVICGDGRIAPFAATFDRVLLDAPCTGLGTLRRHPDIKWRTQPEDAARAAQLQVDLLRSAVQLCKNKGLIVYSVCTTTPQETTAVVEAVLADGNVQPEDGATWLNQWRTGAGQYRTLPGVDGLDGFFLMRLRRVS